MERHYLREGFFSPQASHQAVVKVLNTVTYVDLDSNSPSQRSHSKPCNKSSEQSRDVGFPENLEHEQLGGDPWRHQRAPYRPVLNHSESCRYAGVDLSQRFRPRAASDSDNLRGKYGYRRYQTSRGGHRQGSPVVQQRQPQHNEQRKVHRIASARSVEQAAQHARDKLASHHDRQRALREGDWLSRSRARSDSQLHRKLTGQRRKDWQAVSDCTALIDSSSGNSSAAEDDWPDCPNWLNYSLAEEIAYRDMLDKRLDARESRSSKGTTTNSNIGSKENNYNATAADTCSSHSSDRSDCSSSSSSSSSNSTTTSGSDATHDEQNQSSWHQPQVPNAKMDYLKVPTHWKPAEQTCSGVTSSTGTQYPHVSERRRSSCSSNSSNYHLQQHAVDPLLQHSPGRSRHKTRAPRHFLSGKETIWLSTRVVFVLLILLGMAVVLTSLWFTMECKHRFQAVKPLLPNNSSFCNTMGMPALFAACVVLFNVFGLACTDRKFTGYAIIVISSVEILQAVTTLTFYNCRMLSASRVLASVNASLLECNAAVDPLGRAATPDLPELSLGKMNSGYRKGISREASRVEAGQNRAAFQSLSSKTLPRQRQELSRISDYATTDTDQGTASSRPVVNNSVDKVDVDKYPFLQRDNKRSTKKLSYSSAGSSRGVLPYTWGDENQENEAEIKLPRVSEKREEARNLGYRVDCASDGHFIQVLSRTANQETVNKCRQICRTYQAVCEVSWGDYIEEETFLNVYGSQPASSDARLQADRQSSSSEFLQGFPGAAHDSAQSGQGDIRRVVQNFDNHHGWQQDFRWAVDQCGRRVEHRVQNLCFYDNQVILPLSICAPVAYVLLSCCFIYLARCELATKAVAGCRKMVPSGSISSTNTASIMMSSAGGQRSRAGSMFSSASANSQGTNSKSAGVVSRLGQCCCPCWSSMGKHSNSQSSHELLRLHTVMYSISTIVGLTMIDGDMPVEAV